eukprot:scaffold6665_cov78-Skeletonema_dohrnii-CCMP3373.AAC.5
MDHTMRALNPSNSPLILKTQLSSDSFRPIRITLFPKLRSLVGLGKSSNVSCIETGSSKQVAFIFHTEACHRIWCKIMDLERGQGGNPRKAVD